MSVNTIQMRFRLRARRAECNGCGRVCRPGDLIDGLCAFCGPDFCWGCQSFLCPCAYARDVAVAS